MLIASINDVHHMDHSCEACEVFELVNHGKRDCGHHNFNRLLMILSEDARNVRRVRGLLGLAVSRHFSANGRGIEGYEGGRT